MTGIHARTGRTRSFFRDTRAVAAAEMALVLPIVAFIVLNVVDLATYMYSRMQVDLAAQQAAGIVRQRCTDTPASVCSTTYGSDMRAAMQSTSLGNAVQLGATTEQYYCADASGRLVPMSPPIPSNCSTVVSGSTAKPGSYLELPVTYAYTPIFPKISLASYLTTPIQSTAWIRLP